MEWMKQKVDDMLETFLVIDKAFVWEHPLKKHFAALLLTQKGIPFDKQAFKDTMEHIQSQTGVFSNFRGIYKFSLTSLLIADQTYSENSVKQLVDNEERLKSVGFKSGQHMPMACYTLFKVAQETDPVHVAKRAFELYNEMKKNHPFLTSSDDYSLSILLAHMNPNFSRIETAYNALNKKGFSKSNELQTLSHIIALSDLPVEDLVDKCAALKNVLKENRLASGTSYYASIGVLAVLIDGESDLAAQWVELVHYMNKQKKYKWLGKHINVMFAAAIVSNHYINEVLSNDVMRVTLNLSIEAAIIAQTAALIAMTSAASAGAVASSSSS